MQDGFIFYASYAAKFKKLTDDQFGKLIRLACQYQADGIVPDIADIAVSLAFDVIKVDLDKNNEKYEQICEKRRMAGALGGLAKASNSKQMLASATDAKQNKQELASVANKIKSNVIKINKNNDSSSRRFTPPTLEEVQAYCKERKNNVDAEKFIDFYASKGWMVGSNKMKDWKACVRTWEKRDNDHKQQEQNVSEEQQKRFDKYDDLTKFYLGEV